jgi:Ger(x)C family germination protein
MVILTFLIAGCWDRKEMENRGYVLGIAIDYATPAPKGQYDLPHVTEEAGQRKYRVTFEMPKFPKHAGEETPATGAEQHYIFTGEGESLFAIYRAINAKSYFGPFFEDAQILVISEAVARDGIGDLLDFFSRNPGMRRQIRLLITPGRAENILTGKLQVNEVNSTFIARAIRNAALIPRFATISSLGDVSEAIQNKYSFPIAEVLLENGDIKLTKAAIFNTSQKMIGEFNEWDIVGGKILREVLKDGVITIPNPANPEKLVAFELLEPTIKLDAHVKDGQLWFTLKAKFIGTIGENTEPKQKALDPDFLAAIEQSLADQFTRQVKAAYQKCQDLKTEPMMLGGLVHRQQPQYWKTIKDRWDDEVFPTVPLDIDIKVIVRRTGMIS